MALISSIIGSGLIEELPVDFIMGTKIYKFDGIVWIMLAVLTEDNLSVPFFAADFAIKINNQEIFFNRGAVVSPKVTF